MTRHWTICAFVIGDWHPAPPPAYTAQPGYYGWLPNSVFPNSPNPNQVCISCYYYQIENTLEWLNLKVAISKALALNRDKTKLHFFLISHVPRFTCMIVHHLIQGLYRTVSSGEFEHEYPIHLKRNIFSFRTMLDRRDNLNSYHPLYRSTSKLRLPWIPQ